MDGSMGGLFLLVKGYLEKILAGSGVKVHSVMISLCRHFSDALFAKRESAEYSLRYER